MPRVAAVPGARLLPRIRDPARTRKAKRRWMSARKTVWIPKLESAVLSRIAEILGVSRNRALSLLIRAAASQQGIDVAAFDIDQGREE